MDVVVFGKHVEVDPDLRALTVQKLERVNKFANDVRRIDVDYDEIQAQRAGDSHTCEILVHVNHHLVKGTAASTECAAALDLALDKVERQMRRLHERRVDRRNGTRTRSTRADAVVSDNEPDDVSSPPIAKTKRFAVKPMNPEEAALQMELLGHDFFLFHDKESDRPTVVYRRHAYDYGLIRLA